MNKPSIFVSHGKFPPILDLIERFLIELGIEPVIVERQPSMGLSPNEKVKYYMQKCDAVLILATPDDKVTTSNGEHWQPRQNVIHEIGLAEHDIKKKDKIVFMKEKKTTFPSNINPTYIPFGLRRLDANALIALVRELKFMGLLTVGISIEIKLTVKTNKETYNIGEKVSISGNVPAVIEGVPVAIRVFNPNGILYRIGQSSPTNEMYSYQFQIGGDVAIEGVYIIKATYSGQSVQTSFQLKRGNDT